MLFEKALAVFIALYPPKNAKNPYTQIILKSQVFFYYSFSVIIYGFIEAYSLIH